MATLSECEREAREAAANLVLSTVLPHSVRMGTRVLETLDNMREILSYDSIGCKPTNLEPGGMVGLLRSRPGHSTREASVSAPAHLPEREEEGDRPAGERPAGAGEAGPLCWAEPEDFMKNNAAPIFHSSNHVLVPCQFRHTGAGVSEAELLHCLYRVGDDKYQGKGCAWMAWRLVGQAQPPDVGHHVML